VVDEQRRSVGEVNWAYICHELLACNTDFLGEGSTKHHDLFVVRGGPENFLNIATHV
jgi:hypothetical protein